MQVKAAVAGTAATECFVVVSDVTGDGAADELTRRCTCTCVNRVNHVSSILSAVANSVSSVSTGGNI